MSKAHKSRLSSGLRSSSSYVSTTALPNSINPFSQQPTMARSTLSPSIMPSAANRPHGHNDEDARSGSGSASGFADPRAMSYSDPAANIDDIYLRQLEEDLDAYKYDVAFCDDALEQTDLTPQDTRTLQLRRLDLAHQIRHCRHRSEILRAQKVSGSLDPAVEATSVAASAAATPATTLPSTSKPSVAENGRKSPLPVFTMKRTGGRKREAFSLGGSINVAGLSQAAEPSKKRIKARHSSANETTQAPGSRGGAMAISENEDDDEEDNQSLEEDHDDKNVIFAKPDTSNGRGSSQHFTTINAANTPASGESRLQRLGSWRCRLCTSRKYLLAGAGRVPAAPCKWELKDISKMIVHFTEMHTEHGPAERCAELGAALDRNRGPFEYWLRRTRAQNIGEDGGVVLDCIAQLKAGRLPGILRRLSRAAAGFPQDDD